MDTKNDVPPLGTLPTRTTRRQVLKAGAAGTALVWSVPVIEVVSAKIAAAASAPPGGSVGENISWVTLIFFDPNAGKNGTWYLWQSGGGFQSTLTGIGNISATAFEPFAFYTPLGGITGFSSSAPPGLSITFTADPATGNYKITLTTTSKLSSTLLLEYVLVHGSANAYASGTSYTTTTGTVVVADSTGAYPASSPHEIGGSIPSSIVAYNDVQDYTVGTSTTLNDLGYLVGHIPS